VERGGPDVHGPFFARGGGGAGRQDLRHRGSNVQSLGLVEAYDPVGNTWTTGTSMSTARWGLAAASSNGEIYVFGDIVLPSAS